MSKVFYKFGNSNVEESNDNNDNELNSIYANMIKNAKSENDVLRILEIFVKKNTCKKFGLKLIALENFVKIIFSPKISGCNNNYKDRSIYYYINEILHILIKRIDRDYRIELLIYDIIKKYDKFITALKVCKYGYTPLNTLCWASHKLPFNIFENLTKTFHQLGYDIFMENKLGESSLESLISKFKEDDKFSAEVFTQRYLILTNVTDRQILHILTSTINNLIKLETTKENIRNKYINRIIFCFIKNFNLCYNAIIFRLADLENRKEQIILEKTINILSLVSNKNPKQIYENNASITTSNNLPQAMIMQELYMFFVSEINGIVDLSPLIKNN